MFQPVVANVLLQKSGRAQVVVHVLARGIVGLQKGLGLLEFSAGHCYKGCASVMRLREKECWWRDGNPLFSVTKRLISSSYLFTSDTPFTNPPQTTPLKPCR